MTDVVARRQSEGEHVVRLAGETELHPAAPASIARPVDLKTPTATGHGHLTAVERNEKTFRISRRVLPDGEGRSTTQERRLAGHADTRADTHTSKIRAINSPDPRLRVYGAFTSRADKKTAA